MAGELGYAGGKTIFDDYLREVRPRFLGPRTFQRTVYRPGELVQCDLWEPLEPGAGRARPDAPRVGGDREVCCSRAGAGALMFSKEAPDMLWGMAAAWAAGGVAGEAGVGPRGARTPRGGRPTERVRRVLRAAARSAG